MKNVEKTASVVQELSNDKFIKLGISEGQKKPSPFQKLSEPSKLSEVYDLDYIGALLQYPYIVLDIDSTIQYHLLLDICKSENINTLVIKTKRGGHFWFKTNKIYPDSVGINTPITIKCDVRCHGHLAYVKVKDKRWREIVYQTKEIGDLPAWLTPMKHDESFIDAKEGDGRNDRLFKYIITLTTNGLSREQIKETYRLINDYIFTDKMSDEELNTITRPGAFEHLRPAFFDKKEFKHNVFGDFLRNGDNIYRKNNRLYIYENGYYSQSTDEIESKMINYIPNLLTRQRKEVLNYLLLCADELPKTNPYMICCKNGTLDIRDGELRENNPLNYVLNRISANYNPEAYDEVTDKTLNKITCNNKRLRLLVEEMIGYILIPTTKFQKAFILYGGGKNGKSTLLDMISNLIGDENVSSLSMKELNHNFKLSGITNKLANIGDDINDEYMDDSSIFKKLVTGDELTVDKKNEQPYKIRNYAKLLFATNNLPSSRDKSEGFNRRLIIIPFNAVFSPNDSDYDPFILDKLTTENATSYLLIRAIKGIQRVFANNGFTEVEEVKQIINEFKRDNNNVIQFVEEYHNWNGKATREVYEDYVYWTSQFYLPAFKIRKFNTEFKKITQAEKIIASVDGKSQQIWRK